MVLEALMIGALVGKAVDYLTASKTATPVSPPQRKLPTPSSPSAPVRARERVAPASDHYLRWSLAAVGLTALGTASPLLGAAGIATLGYVNLPILNSAFDALVKQRRFEHSALTAIIFLLSMVNGYFFAMAVGSCFYFVGARMMQRARGEAQQFIQQMVEQTPDSVWLLREGVEISLPLEEVRRGDTLVLRTGDTVPVDGRIIDGMTRIDQQRLTGESRPVERGVGDPVYASTLVLGGRVCVQVEQSGADTLIAQIAEILRHSFDHRGAVQLQGEAWADRSSLPFMLAGALSYVLAGPVAGIVVLNSRPGNGIRFLGALGTLNHVRLAADRGVLVKDGRALERLQTIDTVVFDKTGTLTLEQPRVAQVCCYGGQSQDRVLSLAAAAEGSLTHPFARAIVAESQARGCAIPATADSAYHVGFGVVSQQAQQTVHVGSARFMAQQQIALPAAAVADLERVQQRGDSIVFVALDGQLVGGIELVPSLRPGIAGLMDKLRAVGIKRLLILSGDDAAPTRELAEQLGVDDYIAGVLPEQKASTIAGLQARGRRVCFVGDGINDAMAMQQADVAISLAGASSIAMDAAQLVVTSHSLAPLPRVFDISHRLDSNLRRSLGLVSVIPTLLSIGGLVFFNLGILGSLVVKNGGFAAGLVNAMGPLKARPKLAKLQGHR